MTAMASASRSTLVIARLIARAAIRAPQRLPAAGPSSVVASRPVTNTFVPGSRRSRSTRCRPSSRTQASIRHDLVVAAWVWPPIEVLGAQRPEAFDAVVVAAEVGGQYPEDR